MGKKIWREQGVSKQGIKRSNNTHTVPSIMRRLSLFLQVISLMCSAATHHRKTVLINRQTKLERFYWNSIFLSIKQTRILYQMLLKLLLSKWDLVCGLRTTCFLNGRGFFLWSFFVRILLLSDRFLVKRNTWNMGKEKGPCHLMWRVP